MTPFANIRGLILCLPVSGLVLAAALSGATEAAIVAPPAGIQAFHPGEVLTYDVSWLRVFSAGTVTMAVESAELPDTREGLRFVVEGRTQGLMDRVFPVHDVVQSVFDPQLMQSLSYSLKENYGKKKRLRQTEFDHARRTAVIRLNEDPPGSVEIPGLVQDGLSLIYFLRTREDLVIGRQMEIVVLDSGKLWTIEVAVLAREKIATAAGTFATIKVRTSPKDTGGIVKKREVFLWLTDDGRKVPVRMKSTLKVGSFVFELIGMKPGSHVFRQENSETRRHAPNNEMTPMNIDKDIERPLP